MNGILIYVDSEFCNDIIFFLKVYFLILSTKRKLDNGFPKYCHSFPLKKSKKSMMPSNL